MPNFEYRALAADGKTITGTLSALSRPEVVNQLKAQGMRPMAITESASQAAMAKTDIDPSLHKARVSREDLQVFTSQLASLLSAGIVLSQALAILEEQTESASLSKIIHHVRDDIIGGTSLSDALGKFPKQYSRMFCSMVRVGESGGILDTVLKQLAGFMESENALRSNLTTALAYPFVVILVGLGSVAVLVTFVIPRLSSVFADFGDKLPLATRLLISTSDIVLAYWWLIIALIAGASYLFRKGLQTPQGKELFDTFVDHIPALGPMLIKAQISRFSRTMGTLVKSGIPIINALVLVVDTSSNAVLRKSLRAVTEKVKKGEGLSKPLKETGFFPPMVTNLIAVGEESGKLDDMFFQVANTYDQEVQHAIKRFITLFEPLVIILLALGVGGILMAFLLPILNIGNMIN
jgi:type II secretion system protein F